MSRTAEKVLSIISAVFTALSIVGSLIGLAFFKGFISDPVMRAELEADFLSDPAFAQQDVEILFMVMDSFVGFSWLIIVGLIISLIVTIVGIVAIWNNKNPKLAGAMFIVGGLFAGILSLTSILLYIAAVLSFVRKPPLGQDPSFTEEPYDGAMRPL
ncbi:DUF4064 domain-containing protein [Sporosarcina sp. G11-34]|uniref:DUF4064 domain-containing protein n=1 Tax=Sporosarcina sp. G11-34 TaxID=2849605 RepID=UPI0022A95B44|nr:DUF4064 domain-containing protein [Sporosarcina sp. G11-34]MCZ2260396.1 DUF4064 domain-containing protein [Sporosarcina sp. G11-34]